jgi:hypothetical protein
VLALSVFSDTHFGVLASTLENGGTIEHDLAIAARESARTTKVYDRESDALSLDEIERIAI